MKIIFHLLFLSLITQSTSCSQAKGKIYQKKLIEGKITKGDVFKPEEFEIKLKEQIIKSDINGNLTFNQLRKHIDFGEGFYIHKIHYFDNDNNLILFFEITDDDGSSNDVYCLDKNTLQTVWKTDLWSFNLSVGQSEKEILYLSAGENAYALDMNSGKLIWQTLGFYHIYGFNYFDTIEIIENEIHLKGKSQSKENNEKYQTVVLSKISGKILIAK